MQGQLYLLPKFDFCLSLYWQVSRAEPVVFLRLRQSRIYSCTGKLFRGTYINGSSGAGDRGFTFFLLTNEETRSRGLSRRKRAKEQRESYVFGKESSYIHLSNGNASLSDERVKYPLLLSGIFCLSLDRSGWWMGLPLPVGKWIRDGHDSPGNTTHNLSEQADPFSAWQNDALLESQKAIFLPEDHPGFLPPSSFILCFFLLRFLQDCVGEDSPKSRQQIASFLARRYSFSAGISCVF